MGTKRKSDDADGGAAPFSGQAHPYFFQYYAWPYQQFPQQQAAPTEACIPQERVKMLDEIAVRAYQRHLSEGKAVTVFGLVNEVLSEVGFNMFSGWSMISEVPCLKTLLSVEEKVNAFIVSYIAGNNITTLYDLVTSLCQEEGVSSFEELGFGPLLAHPLIVKYFGLHGVNQVCKITAFEVLQHLSEFDAARKDKYGLFNFLSYLAERRGLLSSSHLCMRIHKFGQYIALIRKARKNERETIENLEVASRKRVKQMVQEFLSSARKVTPTHTRFADSDAEGQLEENKPVNRYSSCPYPSAAEELKRLHPPVAIQDDNSSTASDGTESDLDDEVLTSFVSTWRQTCIDCSVPEVLRKMLSEGKKRKKAMALCKRHPLNILLKLAILTIRGENLRAEGESGLCAPVVKSPHENITDAPSSNSQTNELSQRARHPVIPRHRVSAFVRQALNANRSAEHESILGKCCQQFQVRTNGDLGVSSEDLEALCEDTIGAAPVFYSLALAGAEQPGNSGNVGRLGNRSSLDARSCLARAPLLSELHSWSQWSAVFEPQLGPLLDWLEQESAGAAISVLLTAKGAMLRIADEPQPGKFFSAVVEGQARDSVAQLVSLAVLHGGPSNAPKELLKSQAFKGLEILSAGFKRANYDSKDLARFVLDCLTLAPQEFRLFVAEVLYSAFAAMDSGAPELLLGACTGMEDHSVLQNLGLEMGIYAWIDDYVSQAVHVHKEQLKIFEPVAEPLAKKSKVDPSSNNISPDTIQVRMQQQDQKVSRIGGGETEARELVEAIRRNEFGFQEGANPAESEVLAKQHARIGRALHCLSHNLYSEDCHFILELIQNADDNIYNEAVSPALVFILRGDTIIVLNNEEGFSANNMRALCDVGNSTKQMGSNAGYIGHKGIGFKSVFRVTDSPEIHSNGFHVKFDISQSTLGFILPTWIGPPSDQELERAFLREAAEVGISDAILNTRIDLPLKPSIAEGAGKTVSAMFWSLHPNLLLFLHKLRTLVVQDEVSQVTRVFHRYDLGNNLVQVTECAMAETYLVVEQHLEAAVHRAHISTTELSLAFGLKQRPGGLYQSNAVQQQVFAFLPVRSYGLKFIVQGDFILPSSREEVDRDSAWNQWLLSQIPELFVQALDSFKSFEDLGTRSEAISSYMSFVPLEGEVLGFFSSLPRMILSRLRVVPCLPIVDSGNWALPCTTLRGWDDNLRKLVSDTLLKEHLGMSYLDRGVNLSSALASSLGVHEYGVSTLVTVIKLLCDKKECLRSLGLVWLRQWLLALHKCILLEEQQVRVPGHKNFREELKCFTFIPLSDGNFTSLQHGPVWFLDSGNRNGAAEDQGHMENFVTLYSDLRTIHPGLLVEEAAGEAGIVKQMLTRIGLSAVSAHDIVKSHVLPMLSTNDCLLKDRALVVQYMTYCMLHLQFDKCRSCEVEREAIMTELQKSAVLLTDQGLSRISEQRIHFSSSMKNGVDWRRILAGTGVDWRELSADYFSAVPSYPKQLSTKLCHSFFLELGVSDFVQVVSTKVRVPDKSTSIWKDEDWGTSTEAVVQDWECPEIRQILKALACRDETGGRTTEQCALLLVALDKMWDDVYERYSKASYSAAEARGECNSSFILELRNFPWIASSFRGELRLPGELYHRCEAVEQVLGDHAAYASVQLESSALVRALGLRTHVTADDVMGLFEGSTANFTASLEQMERLYKFLQEKISPKKLKKLLRSKACIFLATEAGIKQRDTSTEGRLYAIREVTWQDPFKLLDKLEEAKLVPAATGSFPTRTLAKQYPAMESFFVRVGAVSEAPSFDDYIGIIQQLGNYFRPSKVLKEVLSLFDALSNQVDNGELGEEEICRRKQLVLESRAAILPAQDDRWVGVGSNSFVLCWCDNAALLEEFEDVSGVVQFVNVGKQSKKGNKKNTRSQFSFLKSLGVAKFSEVVEREVVAYGATELQELEGIIKWILPYAQRYLFQFQPEAYKAFVSSKALEQLSHLQCLVADQLFFRYIVRGNRPVFSRRRIECKCLLQGTKLHVAFLHTKDYATIFLELSRMFFSGNANNDLANFLHLTKLQAAQEGEGNLEIVLATSNGVEPLPEDQTVWTAAEKQQDIEVAEARAFLDKHRLKDSVQKEDDEDEDEDEEPDEVEQEEEEGEVRWPKRVDEQRTATGGSWTQPGLFPNRECLQGAFAANGEQQEVTGRTGERLVFEHLCKKHGKSRVTWVNQDLETGLSYDITVKHPGGVEEFIEVKTTRSSSKDWFEVSCNEWDFAKQAGGRYTIVKALLLGDGRGEIARLVTLRDPVRLCQEKALQLAVILPKRGKHL